MEANDRPTFPYKYGSDLHWLWGWGYRIGDYLTENAIPSESDWILYRPDELAANAMLRFSIDYPTVIEELRARLADTEAAASALEANRNEVTEFRMADVMDV